MDILTQLKMLSKQIQSNPKFEDINNGGCAIFADAVITALQNRGIESYARVCSPSGNRCYSRSVFYARNNAKPNSLHYGNDWFGLGVRFYHVVVEFVIDNVKYFYDSNTLRRNSPRFVEYHVIPGRLSAEEINRIAHDGTLEWNPMFDTGLVPSLQKLVSQTLQPV